MNKANICIEVQGRGRARPKHDFPFQRKSVRKVLEGFMAAAGI
jgi:hypothetical protein